MNNWMNEQMIDWYNFSSSVLAQLVMHHVMNSSVSPQVLGIYIGS